MNPITVSRYNQSRFWAVRDGTGELVCVCVYKRGALEVARRLSRSGDQPGEKSSCESPQIPLDTLRETPYETHAGTE